MPSIGWRTKDGKEVSYEEAKSLASKEGHFEKFPLPILQAMQNDRQDGHWLSPSAAGGCPRQRILERLYPYYSDIESAWTGFTGNAYHREIAAGVYGRVDLQPEMSLQMNLTFPMRDGTEHTMEMRGTADMVYQPLNAPWSIYDWKTVSDFQYYDAHLKTKVNRVMPDPDHILQINLYALMLRWQGIEVDGLYIWYVKSEGKKGVPRKLTQIPLMSVEETFHIACDIAEPLAWYETNGELPKNRYHPSWKPCRFCPLIAKCQELAEEEDALLS